MFLMKRILLQEITKKKRMTTSRTKVEQDKKEQPSITTEQK